MSEQPEPKPAAGGLPIKDLTGRIGKYEIVKPLGKGAMGQVYLARDTMLDRDIALKVMVAQIADDPELKARFEREAKAVAKMSHPNVVNVFDLGYHTDGSPYMAMELLKGNDLHKALRQTPPMTLERKVNTMIQVLQGLAHAHQAGIVHRDIKPANIFINHDGTVKIMDFGVARLTTASMTGTGAIVGTADYMSPEQVKGAKVDGRSDLFSVGCMFYELLAGRRPFKAENLMAIFYKITHEEPDFDAIPAGEDYDALMPILKRALAKNLEDRYPTAYEFATDLRAFLKARPTAEGDHALEGLVDMEPPPTGGPNALTDLLGIGPTVVEGDAPATPPPRSGAASATVRGTQSATVLGSAAATRQGVSRTVALPRGTTVKGAPGTVMRPAAVSVPVPVPQPPAGTSPAVYAALGLGILAVAGVGWVIWTQVIAKPSPPPPSIVETPATAPAPTTTLPAPPPTAAPQPSLAPPEGKAAGLIRSAQTAFKQSDYNRSVSQAQAALKEDPGNADAQRLLENALNGQRARSRFDAAEAALRQNDFAKAESEVEAGRQLAAWDARGPEIVQRIRDAQQQVETRSREAAAQQAAQQLNVLLGQAEAALGSNKYDQAIGLYDQVLAKDPTNQRATLGKTSAVASKAVADAAKGGAERGAAPPPPAGKGFVGGKTVAQPGQPSAGAGGVPPGFEETPGVVAKAATQAADMPGKLGFEVEPANVKPGEKYTVRIVMTNEGNAPIQLRDMVVTTIVNGRRAQGPVPPQTKEVAPAQRAVLLSLPDVWKEDTTAWSMEVLVRTVRGESYRNKVEWK